MVQPLPDILPAYPSAGFLQRIKIRHRPDVCPPWPLFEHIPQGASVLDIGCGVGWHLVTLAALGRISSGYGADVSSKAVGQAALAAKNYPLSDLTFQVIDSIDDVPQEQFDVVMMIDVMHHVPLEYRNATFVGCIKRTKPRGFFIYKDMADEPFLSAFLNRLHDLVSAREMIRYLPLEAALEWAANFDLQLILRSHYTKLFYGHELLVFRKP
ncbi:bifunctional 2-polyprenyl-6-hydroxyphenol methylase/3-demethylubiquinol 3-O-methyltransferase UbiG [Bradyrhizobium sp. WSM3983]|uniref:class I SAM-dependent methyltransferase n=1 Tax=Bradyrhizobium sp. WSM3983 TaxID=1038867 RepID=UPI0018DD5D4B|nr:class I SAM-dependent methyltransferase [Bradyrhizobium sp. WSM3983]